MRELSDKLNDALDKFHGPTLRVDARLVAGELRELASWFEASIPGVEAEPPKVVVVVLEDDAPNTDAATALRDAIRSLEANAVARRIAKGSTR